MIGKRNASLIFLLLFANYHTPQGYVASLLKFGVHVYSRPYSQALSLGKSRWGVHVPPTALGHTPLLYL